MITPPVQPIRWCQKMTSLFCHPEFQIDKSSMVQGFHLHKRIDASLLCMREEGWSGRLDSNQRLRAPKARALTRLSYAPCETIQKGTGIFCFVNPFLTSVCNPIDRLDMVLAFIKDFSRGHLIRLALH